MSEEKSNKAKVFFFCYIVCLFILAPFAHAADVNFVAVVEKIPPGFLKYWYSFLVGIFLSLIINMKSQEEFSEISTIKLFFIEISGIIAASLSVLILYAGVKTNVIVHTVPIAIVYCFIIKFIISFITVKAREAKR